MAYADWQYYKNVYKGIEINTEDEYAYFGDRAGEELALYPISTITDVQGQEQIKRANCRIADILFDAWKRNSNGKVSESVSGYYSVTFATSDDKQVKLQINNAIVLYLGKYLIKGTRNIIY